jgi:hypothetical protein
MSESHTVTVRLRVGRRHSKIIAVGLNTLARRHGHGVTQAIQTDIFQRPVSGIIVRVARSKKLKCCSCTVRAGAQSRTGIGQA